ncbi:MAG TPA: O-antigen ligase family protein [Patescibacteria group bacterium]|nr:O-antigen ligase family protein [Patescibacteria group bacterium]
MQIIRRIPFWGALALLIYMPFHIFLSQWISLATGGLSVWKLAKDAMLLILVVFTICLVWKKRAGTKEFNLFVAIGAGYALLHLVLWAFHPSLEHDSAILGAIYNNRVLDFLILGMGVGLLVRPKGVDTILLTRIILSVSAVVALFGVAQYFLPKDIMTHFGYSLSRGVRPDFFIDNNPALPRVMSTLRDPNSLGAYLIIPITMTLYLLMKAKTVAGRLSFGALALLYSLALYFTFSRSAWVGAIIAIGFLTWWQFKGQIFSIAKRWWPIAVCLILLAAGGLFALRNNGIVSHTTKAQVGDYSSNDYHWIYVKKGLTGIWHNPLGHGPGTAGLASIQNRNGGLLTENYYVQIGYEVGVAGLLVFIAANILVCVYLWRCKGMWPPVLLASFLGYVFINMLLHSWSNEAVAAQWWIMAGLILSTLHQPVKRAR